MLFFLAHNIHVLENLGTYARMFVSNATAKNDVKDAIIFRLLRLHFYVLDSLEYQNTIFYSPCVACLKVIPIMAFFKQIQGKVKVLKKIANFKTV